MLKLTRFVTASSAVAFLLNCSPSHACEMYGLDSSFFLPSESKAVEVMPVLMDITGKGKFLRQTQQILGLIEEELRNNNINPNALQSDQPILLENIQDAMPKQIGIIPEKANLLQQLSVNYLMLKKVLAEAKILTDRENILWKHWDQIVHGKDSLHYPSYESQYRGFTVFSDKDYIAQPDPTVKAIIFSNLENFNMHLSAAESGSITDLTYFEPVDVRALPQTENHSRAQFMDAHLRDRLKTNSDKLSVVVNSLKTCLDWDETRTDYVNYSGSSLLRQTFSLYMQALYFSHHNGKLPAQDLNKVLMNEALNIRYFGEDDSSDFLPQRDSSLLGSAMQLVSWFSKTRETFFNQRSTTNNLLDKLEKKEAQVRFLEDNYEAAKEAQSEDQHLWKKKLDEMNESLLDLKVKLAGRKALQEQSYSGANNTIDETFRKKAHMMVSLMRELPSSILDAIKFQAANNLKKLKTPE